MNRTEHHIFFLLTNLSPDFSITPLSHTASLCLSLTPHSHCLTLSHTPPHSLSLTASLSQTPQCLSRWLCFSPSPTRLSPSLASSAACRRCARARCSLFHAVVVLVVRCFKPSRCLLFAAVRLNACNFLLFSYHFMDSVNSVSKF